MTSNTLLQTNLSVGPYYDDFDNSKNYYKILYKPATAVQVRELNSTQSILQDQIDKFGRSVYKEGSVTEGCSFTFDNNYNYVKINDAFSNGFIIPTTSTFVGGSIVNQNGLKATIVNSVDGFQASSTGDLNTLYIKYLNSGTFTNGAVQSVFSNTDTLSITSSGNSSIGSAVVATAANSTGSGYAVSVTSGVIFKKGFFINILPQTLVVTKYNNVPDGVSVGFNVNEIIVSSSIDGTLYDNATNSSNFNAPGADRLKLVPTLVTVNTASISTSSSFFSLVDFKQGLPVTIKTDPQYVSLSKELARRTYETSGNYVVNPFLLSVTNKSANDALQASYLNLISSPGIGYVQGYRVEFINNNNVNLRKGIDIQSVSNQNVTANFGYYVNVNQYCGDFNNFLASQIEIHSVPKLAITSRNFLNTGYSSTTKIGTAFCRGFSYASGTPGVDAIYRLYLFNIKMSPGYNFSQAQSFIYYNSGIKAVADSILTINAAGVNVTQIQDPLNEIMIHPFGQKAIVPGGFGSNTASYVFRNRVLGNTSAAAFNTAGQLSLSIPNGNQQFLYTGTYSPTLDGSFIVTPLSNMLSGNSSGSFKTGTVNVYNTNTSVLGTSSLFTTEYSVGDYIYVSNNTRRIVSISNSTALNVDAVFSANLTAQSHQKIYPSGVPINFQNSYNRSIVTTTNTATLSLGETITTSTNCAVYFDVKASNLAAAKKVINRGTLIQINTNTHPNGVNGPWSLGIPDVLNLNHVYVGNGTFSNTNPDLLSSFSLDNGQRDSFYDLASISSTAPMANNSYLLVSVDNFTINTAIASYGFFTANSYPIDDANTSNTSAIRTAQIPQYVSINTKTISDLRDAVDFRPYMANTANAVAITTGSATTNPANSTSVYQYSATSPYIPSPDSPFSTSLQFYLPRVDRIALTTGGNMIITEGTSAVNPVPAAEIPGTMTIGLVNVPAYPTLVPNDATSYKRYDYSVQITIQQTRRYTMADIGTLDNRIHNLEYYTSLNLLEQSASSLLVRSSVTGQNRFQNGIMVDPFLDFSIGNTNDPNFSIAIDTNLGQARPYFKQSRSQLYFDPAQSTLQKTGSLITLPYTSSVTQTQQFASKYRNCIEGNIYNWTGNMVLTPSGTIDPDITQGPNVVSNLNLSQNWINIANAWGTVWGNWTTVGQSTATTTASSQVGATTNPDGSVTNVYQSQTTSLTTQQQQQIGQQLSVTPSTTTVNVGSFVTNINILPFIKSTPIFFKVSGLKPSTMVYAYFNNVPVSNYCIPLTVWTGSIQMIRNLPMTVEATPRGIFVDKNNVNYTFTTWGNAAANQSNLITDSAGNLYGVFIVPDSTFQAGQIQFMVTDIYNLSQGISAATTSASATYLASSLSVQQSQVSLQVQIPQVAVQDVINNQTVQQISTTTASYSTVTAAPPPPITAITPALPIVYQTQNNDTVPQDGNGGGGGTNSASDGNDRGGGGGP